MRMKDMVVLITGGSTGIGKATAVRFAAEGAKVAITGREKAVLQATAEEIAAQGGEVIWIDGDVQLKSDVNRMVDTVLGNWGTIDVLVNNAGICSPASFLEIEESEWDRHMAINLKGTFLVGQAVARCMVQQGKSGSIINMSSVNGLAAEKDQAHYNATKGGINLLTMSMALELAPLGIRVNALCPGFIETRLTKPLIDNPAAFAPYLETIPMGRAGVPEEIADAALFMATSDSRYMTGHCLVVDGGQLIKLS
ncbi:SDR family NAD(P)-dependent oxidoreductase [Paenibacillus qinlingensis]|uniref:NAD(P)-dependent dehydrogenase (Short-subunit alcohol dehydrogenase family) n=1 Tax=Paenibacillus qinlingensis TaxID=1837343 RepID=A0ABU1NST1_9BACL|nr:SDR family NAD(P)-dependent oxidoreductase [Paenibacillus qinlingensis]MDR6550493.1 NAD(P)-dependent dehydrogenase (short-subunit alcohol dehydrogenase family) [Paenibacillus qinlingensis]